MSFETLIRQGKPKYVQADIQEVTSSILQRLEHSERREQTTSKFRRWSWKRRVASATTVLGCVLLGTGTVAYADGVNVLSVVVQFVHNITSGSGYGAGYGLENTAVSLTLPTSSEPSTPAGAAGTVQQAHVLSSPQLMRNGGLFDTGYNAQLVKYLGTSQFPELIGENVTVGDIQAFSLDRMHGIFYMYVNGVVTGGHDQTIGLDVYHNTGGTVVINGQTTANIKQQVTLAGINATYVEFTNDQSFLNYLTWKSGAWIFVLRSNNVPKQMLVKYAQGIENQVAVG